MTDASRSAAFASPMRQQPPAGATGAAAGGYGGDYQQQQYQWQQYWQSQQQQQPQPGAYPSSAPAIQPPPPGSAVPQQAAYTGQQGYGVPAQPGYAMSEAAQQPPAAYAGGGYGGSSGGNSYYQSDRYAQAEDSSYGRYGDSDAGGGGGYGSSYGHSGGGGGGSYSDGGYGRRGGGGGGGYRGGGSSEYGGRGRGNYRGGYHQQGAADGEKPTYVEQKDSIFVQGLSESCTDDMLVQFFGALGPIKEDDRNGRAKVYIYKDKITNRPKGEATVTFVDEASVQAAIDRYNGQYFPGSNSTMKVSIAKRRMNPAGDAGRGGYGGDRGRGGRGRGAPRGGGSFGDRGGGRGGDRGGRGGRGGGPISGANMEARAGDWPCPSCGNNNFAFRKTCNQCQTSKPDDDGDGGGGGYGGGYGGRGGGGPMRGGRDSRFDSGRGGGRSRPY